MSELHNALLGPLIALVFLLGARRWPQLGVSAPLWVAGLYIVPFAMACFFTFPSLDDWSYGASGQRGWWAAQQEWYHGWSGRITATALLTGWGTGGSPGWAALWGYRCLILVIFLATCWALWDFFGALEPTANKRERSMLTAVSITGWLCLLRDPGEGLYWLAGVASYSVGCLLILIACSSLLRGGSSGSRWHWWIASISVIGACLCSEVVAGLALSITSGFILFILRGRQRWGGVAVLVSGLLATAVLLGAPGNDLRAAIVLQERSAPVDRSVCGLVSSTAALLESFFHATLWAPLAAFGAWLAWRSPHHRPLHGLFALLLISAFAVVAAIPMAWAGMSPERAWNPVTTCCAVTVVWAAWRGGPTVAPWLLALSAVTTVLGCAPGLDQRIVPLGAWAVAIAAMWLLRHRLDRHLVAAAVVCALLLGSTRYVTTLRDVGRGPNYAAQQHQRLQVLAAATPDSDITVSRLTGDLPYLYHIDDLRQSSRSWHNQGCAAFFGLRSVRTQSPVISLAPPQPESP